MLPSPLSRGEKGGQGQEMACCRPLRAGDSSTLGSCNPAGFFRSFTSLCLPVKGFRHGVPQIISATFLNGAWKGTPDDVQCGLSTPPPPPHTQPEPSGCCLCKSIFPIPPFNQGGPQHRASQLHISGDCSVQVKTQNRSASWLHLCVITHHVPRHCWSAATPGHRHIFPPEFPGNLSMLPLTQACGY